MKHRMVIIVYAAVEVKSIFFKEMKEN